MSCSLHYPGKEGRASGPQNSLFSPLRINSAGSDELQIYTYALCMVPFKLHQNEVSGLNGCRKGSFQCLGPER